MALVCSLSYHYPILMLSLALLLSYSSAIARAAVVGRKAGISRLSASQATV